MRTFVKQFISSSSLLNRFPLVQKINAVFHSDFLGFMMLLTEMLISNIIKVEYIPPLGTPEFYCLELRLFLIVKQAKNIRVSGIAGLCARILYTRGKK